MTATAPHPQRLIRALVLAELRVFLRQPVMVGLTLLLPVGLIAITALAETSDSPALWASIAGRNMVAALCITVYFVALNTVTARRHTLALKRLRTTALPSLGIIAGLLAPPFLVGAFQICAVFAGLIGLGAPVPQHPGLVVVSGLLGMVVAALAGVATSGFTATPEKAQWTMLPLFVATMGATAILPTLEEGAANLGARAVPLVANAHLATAGWHSEVLDVGAVVVDLTFMIVWIAALSVVSWRTFRWERRH
jgi:ABC-2 type transport system permease protein